MTAATLTLTDFLLARIAEDEDQAHRDVWADQNWGLPLPVGDRTKWAGRMLSECEAKRRLVDAHPSLPVSWISPCGNHSGRYPADCRKCERGTDYRCPCGARDCMVLRALAVVHSTHPDYRDEWKP